MTRLPRPRRRELERELRGVATPPPPPADLLAKIVEEIPEDLGAGATHEARRPRRPWHATTAFRLAATVAIAAVGVVLAYRTLERPRGQEVAPLARREGVTATAEPRRDQPTVQTRKVTEAAPLAESKSKDEKLSDTEGTAERQAPSGTPAAPAPPALESLSSLEKKVTEAAPGTAAEAPAPAPPPAGVVEPAEAEAQRRIRTPDSLGAIAAQQAAPERQDAAAPAGVARKRNEGFVADEARGRGSAGEKEEAKAPYFLGIPPKAPPAPSTGGTAEPLDQPAGDMFFRPTGVNPFVDTAEDRFSTFALDTDTGSWTLARSYLERGALPPAAAIRVEEFVNAQTYEDPAPRRSDFTLTAEGAPTPFAAGARYRLLRFAVRARDVAAGQRKPAVLTFVVDVSGSMGRENRLGLVRRALDLLLDELAPEDRVGLVVYGSRGRVLLRHTRDLEEIREAIARLVPEGSTNAEEGLRLAYDLADQGYRQGAINRIVLCSDGVANVGATGPESILERIGTEARRGIELTTVGFGMGNYNDALMEQLADQGDGSYHYVDTLDDARRAFVDNLTGTLQTVARDARVQVEFEPATVERWRLLGYENRDVADRDFRNDRVDAGEVGVGTAATALYEVRLRDDARGGDRLATLRLRWKSVDGARVVEARQGVDVGDVGHAFARASRDLRVAAVAAELAERLKGSFYARDTGWEDLRAAAHELRRDYPADAGVAELASVVDRAAHRAAARPEPDRPLPGDDDPPGEDPLER